MAAREMLCQWKMLLLLLAVLAVIGFDARLFRWLASIPSDQDQKLCTTASRRRIPTRDPTIMGVMAPDLRPLNPQKNPRDKCLLGIRQRHEDLLRSHIVEADHILYLDPSYHQNVGDTMLTLGTLKFLGDDKKITQCDYWQTHKYVKLGCDTAIRNLAKLAKEKNLKVLALWHPGGNWGDIWPRTQINRMHSMGKIFKAGFKLLAMPSSYHYINPKVEQQDAAYLQANFTKYWGPRTKVTRQSPRVIFTWREQYSYEQGLKHYPFATNLLVPDIALQLGPYATDPIQTTTSKDLLAFLRTDKESVVDRKGLKSIIEDTASLTYTIADWESRLKLYNTNDFLDTNTAAQLMSLAKVNIVDRLHASIMTFLVDRPLIYVDQMSGKLNKTLTVALASEGCQLQALDVTKATSLEDAVDKAVKVLGLPRYTKEERKARRIEAERKARQEAERKAREEQATATAEQPTAKTTTTSSSSKKTKPATESTTTKPTTKTSTTSSTKTKTATESTTKTTATSATKTKTKTSKAEAIKKAKALKKRRRLAKKDRLNSLKRTTFRKATE